MRSDNGRPRMPLSLRIAVGILVFQTLANTAAGVLMLVFAAEDVEHGRTVPTLTYVLAVASVIIGVVLLVCVVLLLGRNSAARPVVAAVEVFGMVNGLAGLLLGAPQSVVGLVLAFLVLFHVFRPESTAWLEPWPEEEDVPVAD